MIKKIVKIQGPFQAHHVLCYFLFKLYHLFFWHRKMEDLHGAFHLHLGRIRSLSFSDERVA